VEWKCRRVGQCPPHSLPPPVALHHLGKVALSFWHDNMKEAYNHYQQVKHKPLLPDAHFADLASRLRFYDWIDEQFPPVLCELCHGLVVAQRSEKGDKMEWMCDEHIPQRVVCREPQVISPAVLVRLNEFEVDMGERLTAEEQYRRLILEHFSIVQCKDCGLVAFPERSRQADTIEWKCQWMSRSDHPQRSAREAEVISPSLLTRLNELEREIGLLDPPSPSSQPDPSPPLPRPAQEEQKRPHREPDEARQQYDTLILEHFSPVECEDCGAVVFAQRSPGEDTMEWRCEEYGHPPQPVRQSVVIDPALLTELIDLEREMGQDDPSPSPPPPSLRLQEEQKQPPREPQRGRGGEQAKSWAAVVQPSVIQPSTTEEMSALERYIHDQFPPEPCDACGRLVVAKRSNKKDKVVWLCTHHSPSVACRPPCALTVDQLRRSRQLETEQGSSAPARPPPPPLPPRSPQPRAPVTAIEWIKLHFPPVDCPHCHSSVHARRSRAGDKIVWGCQPPRHHTVVWCKTAHRLTQDEVRELDGLQKEKEVVPVKQEKKSEEKQNEEKREVSSPVAVDSSSRVNNDCAVCCDAVIDCLLMPCKHLSMCTPCAERLPDCPICRTQVSHTHTPYLTLPSVSLCSSPPSSLCCCSTTLPSDFTHSPVSFRFSPSVVSSDLRSYHGVQDVSEDSQWSASCHPSSERKGV
jgi:hypothetical protein